MTGIVLDSILIALLLAAIAYGIKLERKLKALRDGQLAFAAAVTELNSAAGRAENALATLRASGQETDLLHDRIMKARAVKQELEVLIARAPRGTVRQEPVPTPLEEPLELHVPASAVTPLLDDEARARRMASLMERMENARAVMKAPSQRPVPQSKAPQVTAPQAPMAEEPRPSPMLQALAANQAAQQRLNRARRSLDDDMFAA